MIELLLLILGIAGVIFGTHLIIKGALNIAEHFKLSRVFIGLTVLAIGTDLPELVINANASIQKLLGVETSGLIIGHVTGSCMAQIGLTLGILGLFGTSLFITKKESIREGAMLLGSVALFFILGIDGSFSRIDGAIFLLIYAVYFVILYKAEKKKEREVKRAPTLRLGWALLSLAAGFGILIYSSEIVVNSAVALASMWGLAQSFIGIVIIGIGTSLPELSVTLGAIAKKAPRLSVGNLIGSNIFDIMVVLGLGGSISTLAVDKTLLFFDIPFLFLTSFAAVMLFLTNNKLTKKEATVLLAIYSLYIFLKIVSI